MVGTQIAALGCQRSHRSGGYISGAMSIHCQIALMEANWERRGRTGPRSPRAKPSSFGDEITRYISSYNRIHTAVFKELDENLIEASRWNFL
jgi:hypothetical protein